MSLAQKDLNQSDPDGLRLNEVSQRIKDRALDLGFHKVGITRAEPLTLEQERLSAWLSHGRQAEMNWMARAPEERTDPRLRFPEARSVIAVALNYYTPHQHKETTDTGKVSRYAWGDDYHDVVGEKLRALLSWITEEQPQARGKVCVDIQPVMDKAWADRAGLGWIGKHSNLITREYGSWVFLGELLLNLELAYDTEQVADQCGACTLCIDACPTGAIVAPYQIDSGSCISHATIESRAPQIIDRVSSKLEGWIYGCDICQDVCPWNQMTPASDEPRFEPRAGNVNLSLSEINVMSPEIYQGRFRRSAMKRAKLSGLQRNARALQANRPPN